ncbi:hypothetical protein KJ765_00995 [Candidatus Micrarchaeota archaeon]|nr:hypothetical protein [Candidatus Micrarchaeota archaeon]
MFSSDFAIGLLVFLVVLALILPLWDNIRFHTVESANQRMIHSRALAVSDMLVRSPGSPSDWNETSVQSAGLANTEHLLNVTKVLLFMNALESDYYHIKSLIGIPRYDLNVSVTDANGTPLTIQGNETRFGRDSSSARDVISVTRIALLQWNETSRQIVNLNVVVWD